MPVETLHHLHGPAFSCWSVCAVVLFVKMFALSLIQAGGRTLSGKFPRPEDARAFARGADPIDKDIPIVERATWAWRNDLENIPIFLFLSLAFLLAGGPDDRAVIYFSVFTTARVLHSIVYLLGKQPHRFLCYNLGVAATFVLAGHLLALVLP